MQNTYLRIRELAERVEVTYTILGINLASATALMQVGDDGGDCVFFGHGDCFFVGLAFTH